ncbi:MAG: Glu-tRNA(Gln) amidotransferase subunit GatE [Candidatus Woesearchaeota archaeon]
MEDLDYSALGFKCGLEFHQQIGGRKLFCKCFTALQEEGQKVEFERKIRPFTGESGKVDIAGAYERLRNRSFVYHGYEDECCLIDMDEEPPMPVNQEALKMALEVATLLKLKIPDTICVMRKGVFDGSSVTSFQRTMIIGLGKEDSFIETLGGNVRIDQLNLEEDACKIEKREGNKVYYSLSRQGIPLLELGTAPDIKSPEHAVEVAKLFGMIFRSFPLTIRGIGTIRQDVNVSIKGGTRIEIKGWQDLRTLGKLVKNEVLRQKTLLEIKEELKDLESIDTEPKEATLFFDNCSSRIVRRVIEDGGKVFALKLPKFSGLLKREVCEGKTFGKELAEYAMAYGTKGMIHSDEDLEKYGLEQEFHNLKPFLDASDDDLILIVAEMEEVALKAVNAVLERVKYCLIGIPEETRVPNHVNATSSYARPLPGSSRMYPESDIHMIKVTHDLLKSIKLPELLAEKAIRFEKEYGLNPEMAKQVVRMHPHFFEELVTAYKNVEPNFLAAVIASMPRELKSRYGLEGEKLTEDNFREVIGYLDEGKISKDSVLDALASLVKGEGVEIVERISEDEITSEIRKIVEDNPGVSASGLMGEVMGKFKGKVDGRKAKEILDSILS